MATKINGYAVTGLGAGVLLFWSGLTGKSVTTTLQSVIQGKNPGTNPAVNAPQDAATGATAAASGPGGPVLGSYSRSQLAQLWTANGGPQATADFAAQVALSESSGNAKITSSNPDGGTNVGLWQLDTLGVGAGHSVSELQDPNTNARITITATAGGYNWSEWSDPVVNALGGSFYSPGGG